MSHIQNRCCYNNNNSTPYRDFAYAVLEPPQSAPIPLPLGQMPTVFDRIYSSSNSISIVPSNNQFTRINIYSIGDYKISFTMTAEIIGATPSTVPLIIESTQLGRPVSIFSASAYNNRNLVTLSFDVIVERNRNIAPNDRASLLEFVNGTSSNIRVYNLLILVERLSNYIA